MEVFYRRTHAVLPPVHVSVSHSSTCTRVLDYPSWPVTRNARHRPRSHTTNMRFPATKNTLLRAKRRALSIGHLLLRVSRRRVANRAVPIRLERKISLCCSGTHTTNFVFESNRGTRLLVGTAVLGIGLNNRCSRPRRAVIEIGRERSPVSTCFYVFGVSRTPVRAARRAIRSTQLACRRYSLATPVIAGGVTVQVLARSSVVLIRTVLRCVVALCVGFFTHALFKPRSLNSRRAVRSVRSVQVADTPVPGSPSVGLLCMTLETAAAAVTSCVRVITRYRHCVSDPLPGARGANRYQLGWSSKRHRVQFSGGDHVCIRRPKRTTMNCSRLAESSNPRFAYHGRNQF